MFRIDTNQSIYISRGDDIHFPLFVNKGTNLEPIRYVFAENDGCEVYFLINTTYRSECPAGVPSYKTNLLKKTFKTDGTIISEYGGEIIETTDNEIINENGDIIISLTSEETDFIPEGKYLFQIRAKLLQNDEYLINTITNKHQFNVIDREDLSVLIGD